MTQFSGTPTPEPGGSLPGRGPGGAHLSRPGSEQSGPREQFSAGEPPTTGERSTTDVAQEQAGEVAGSATEAGKHVAGVAGEQASQVKSEATQQAKDLWRQTQGELNDQAATQQNRAAQGLRSLSEELRSMARGSEQPGMATDLAHQAAERTNTVASWLDQHEPGHVLDEVTRFARRRPGAFLAISAGAGFLVGRLGRGLKAAGSNDAGDGAARDLSSGDPGAGAEYTTPEYATVPPPPGYQPSGYPAGPAYPQSPPPHYPPGSGYPAQPPRGPGYPPAAGGPQQGPGYPPPGPGYPRQEPDYPQPPTGRDLAP